MSITASINSGRAAGDQSGWAGWWTWPPGPGTAGRRRRRRRSPRGRPVLRPGQAGTRGKRSL